MREPDIHSFYPTTTARENRGVIPHPDLSHLYFVSKPLTGPRDQGQR